MSDLLIPKAWVGNDIERGQLATQRMDLDFDDGSTATTIGYEAREADDHWVVDLTIEPDQIGDIRDWGGKQYALISYDQLKLLERAVDHLNSMRPNSARANVQSVLNQIQE